jgi:peptidoglycan L-alanyl-D-glutamate endopeptidase CwlK
VASRKIEDLSEAMLVLYYKWADEMNRQGIDFLITCTLRSLHEQQALYAQGRTTPGKIVTWTMKSKHLTGDAFDFVIMENGKPDWQVSNPKWAKAVEIGESIGLESLRPKEWAHLQLKD